MKKITLLLILLLSTFFFLFPALSVWSQEPVSKKEKYHHEGEGFSIEIPTNWEVREDFWDTSLLAISPKEGPGDPFQENFTIIVENLSEEFTLEEYFNLAFNDISREGEDFQAQEIKNLIIDNQEAKKLEYSVRMESVTKRYSVYFLVRDLLGYKITFTALSDSVPSFRNTFDEIANSFRFEKAPKKRDVKGKAEKDSEDTTVYFGLGGSYSIEDFDTSLDYDSKSGGRFKFGYNLNNNISLEFDYDYVFFELDEVRIGGGGYTDSVEADLDIMTYLLSMKITPDTRVLKPYVIFGFGVMDAKAEGGFGVGDVSFRASADDTDGAARFGLGIDFYPTSVFSIGLEASYVMGISDLENIRYIPCILGFAFHL